MNPDFASTGDYYCEFLAKQKDDATCSDELNRWWPNWYRYSNDSLTTNIIFGSQTLICPNFTPYHTKYKLWADKIDLSVSDVTLTLTPISRLLGIITVSF